MRKLALLGALGLLALGLERLTANPSALTSGPRVSYSDWDSFKELFH